MVLTHQERLRDRPCEARQPAFDAMVLIPAERSLEDERRGFFRSHPLLVEEAIFCLGGLKL